MAPTTKLQISTFFSRHCGNLIFSRSIRWCDKVRQIQTDTLFESLISCWLLLQCDFCPNWIYCDVASKMVNLSVFASTIRTCATHILDYKSLWFFSGKQVIVCAHRFVKNETNHRWGNGQCFTLTQQLKHSETWDPCEFRKKNRYVTIVGRVWQYDSTLGIGSRKGLLETWWNRLIWPSWL